MWPLGEGGDGGGGATKTNAAQQYRREDQEKLDKAKEREAALYSEAEDACVIFCEMGHLLDQLNTTELQDIVRYLCCVEKRGKGDIFLNNSGSKTKLKAIISEVKPVWTKSFQLAPVAEEKEDGE